MRAGRPASLEELRRDRMHQVVGNASDRAKAARSTFTQAREFRRAAESNLAEGLVLPAVSALHESARLAVTALAALDGYRFSNTAGAHEAVVDYAFGIKLVDRAVRTARPASRPATSGQLSRGSDRAVEA